MRAAPLVLLLVPALAGAQAGRVLLSVGEATLVRGAQEARLAGGAAVERGDTVRTGERSSVQIRMSDASIISLRSNTVFRIDEYQYSGDKGEGERSVFSLLKGGLRTVSGAIARPAAEARVRTAAAVETPSVEKKREPAREAKEGESKIAEALRAITGAVTRAADTRHVVRTPTSTVGIRGTHYTIVHCDNDCFEPRRTTVAAATLAQSDASGGLGDPAPNGTYGAVSDGRVGVANNVDDREFGAFEFFYVASLNSMVQALVGPRWFLYDRLEAQERNRGQSSPESTETMARSGLNAESRSSELAIPPAPPAFVVTEQRNASGDPLVISGPAANTAFLTAFTPASGFAAIGAFVDASALTNNFIDGVNFFTAFNAPAGSTIDAALGAYSGAASSILDQTNPNPLNAYWGIWFDGSATTANGTTTFGPGNNAFHYLVGPLTPPDVIAAKSGSFSFSNVGGTSPTHSDSTQLGSFSSSPWTVDFSARTVSSSGFGMVFSNQTWSLGGFTAPIQFSAGRGAYIDATSTGTCSGASCATSTPAQARTQGIFMGAGDHLGAAINARAGPASAQTVQIFSCAPRC